MTIIVGTIETDHVYLGADSCASHGCLLRPFHQSKVWRQGDLVLGLSGRVRETQILRYLTELPSVPTDGDLMPWLVGPVIDAIRSARKSAGHDERIEGQSECEYGPVLLLGVRGQLFGMHGDYSVSEYPDGAAVGSGEVAAWGSLRTSQAVGVSNPRERVRLALEAACAHDIYCAPPFSFVDTESAPGTPGPGQTPIQPEIAIEQAIESATNVAETRIRNLSQELIAQMFASPAAHLEAGRVTISPEIRFIENFSQTIGEVTDKRSTTGDNS